MNRPAPYSPTADELVALELWGMLFERSGDLRRDARHALRLELEARRRRELARARLVHGEP